MTQPQHLTVEDLAERWQKRPTWITQHARMGEIPGAWKLGHFWRFNVADIEAYELAQQSRSIFALSPGAQRRLDNQRR